MHNLFPKPLLSLLYISELNASTAYCDSMHVVPVVIKIISMLQRKLEKFMSVHTLVTA